MEEITIEKYIAAELEIIEFDNEDVITTSFLNGENSGDIGSGSIISF